MKGNVLFLAFIPIAFPFYPSLAIQIYKTQGKKEILMSVVCSSESHYITHIYFLLQLCVDLKIRHCRVFQLLFI